MRRGGRDSVPCRHQLDPWIAARGQDSVAARVALTSVSGVVTMKRTPCTLAVFGITAAVAAGASLGLGDLIADGGGERDVVQGHMSTPSALSSTS